MKKLLVLFTILLLLVSCKKINKHKETEEEKNAKIEICRILEEKTGDKFWFIYGLHYDDNPATNIRYRGIIYSKKLEDLNWPQGVEIGLENLENLDIASETIEGNYQGLLMQIEIDGMAEKKAKEIFGPLTNLYNEGMTTDYMYDVMINKQGQNIPFEKKSGYYYTVINVFVDDLDKVVSKDYKLKTMESARYFYEYMNCVTYTSVYVRDNKFFRNYDLVYDSIYKPFRERSNIKVILTMIKDKKEISAYDKEILVNAFSKGSLDYEKVDNKEITLNTKDKEYNIDINYTEFRESKAKKED